MARMNTSGVIAEGQVGWRRDVLSHDIDEFAQAQANWSLHYEQLSGGAFVGALQHVQLPGMRLVREASSCATWQRGHIGARHIGLAMPLRMPGPGSFNGQAIGLDSMMIGRSEQLDLCMPADSALIAIVVDADLLDALWQHLYQKRMSAWIDRQIVVDARPGLAQIVRSVHLRVMADVEAAPALLNDAAILGQMRDAVLVEWIEALPTRITTEGLGTGEARKRVVTRACELMHAQPAEPLSILQVCERVGASPSKLEYCFRSVLGIAPAKYMRAIRLNGVRRELRQAHSRSVQDVAARWGFWHLGEFAAAYRRQFGELPSQTLRGTGGEP